MAAKRCVSLPQLLPAFPDWPVRVRRVLQNRLHVQLRLEAFNQGRHTLALQHAHVGIPSILRKNPELLPLPAPSQIVTVLLMEPASRTRDIVFLLGLYPDVVKTTLPAHQLSGVVTFAFCLSHVDSSAWESVIVKREADVEKARASIWMYLCAREELAAAMRLLNLKPLEGMRTARVK